MPFTKNIFNVQIFRLICVVCSVRFTKKVWLGTLLAWHNSLITRMTRFSNKPIQKRCVFLNINDRSLLNYLLLSWCHSSANHRVNVISTSVFYFLVIERCTDVRQICLKKRVMSHNRLVLSSCVSKHAAPRSHRGKVQSKQISEVIISYVDNCLNTIFFVYRIR